MWIDWRNLRMCYPFQCTDGPISYQNGWFFFVCVIPLWDFLPKWNSTLWYRIRGELAPAWLVPVSPFLLLSLKWMQSHKREPEWTPVGTKVALVSCKHPLSEIMASEPRYVFLWIGDSSRTRKPNWNELLQHDIHRKTKVQWRMRLKKTVTAMQ